MQSQWMCLLKNVGNWHGSFTQLAPDGTLISDIPTVTSLISLNDDTTIQQVIRRMPAGEPPTEQVLTYSSLGRGILLFESGAFSQGSLQLGPFGEFGAELGLIWGDRRLRLVQLFRDRRLTQFTLIREQLGVMPSMREQLGVMPSMNVTPPSLTPLVGEWRGEATTLYPDWRTPETTLTQLTIRQEHNRLVQTTTFAGQTIVSTADITGSRLQFKEGAQPVQVLLLPDGASATCPTEIRPQTPFFLEVGWLAEPDTRLRMSRWYDASGAWVSLTLVV
ncbi:MAG: DUF3598 family protein, partial [Cyanobacteriota bacterium SKYGB_h_bin112]|nr:DUF3598 family protein [Cyanobacteriota bacterium SKYGB_h_bin112]